MKNIPKIEIKTMIGYSNLFNLLSIIKFLDEFKTNKLVIKINILKKFDNSSLTKLSKNIFSVLSELLKIMAIVIIIINEDRLKIKLKLFLIKTPSIKIEKIESDKKISGRSIFKLLIIYFEPYLELNLFDN
jgi:hypothetical protein